MRAIVWLPLSLVLLASACAEGRSRSAIAPALVVYAPEVQARAAKELERLGPPCPRVRVQPGCSAVRLMMDDYGDLRARVRVMWGGALIR